MALTLVHTLKGTFQGLDVAGSIALPGARVGDELLKAGIVGTLEDDRGAFEMTISVDGQIQQGSSSPLASHTFEVVLLRAISTA